MSRIETALTRLYDKHRIVFWYDDKRELRAEFDALILPDVEKIVLDDNEFLVKHRILREERKQKFLLYRSGPPPEPLDNWLLDVQLAHVVFSADQIALWLSDLGLGLIEFGEVARQHRAFFESARRREKLSDLLQPKDSVQTLRLKMLAVITGADPQLDAIVEQLLDELAREKETAVQLIERCGLTDFLWQQVGDWLGYASQTPSVRDFALALFAGCYAMLVGDGVTLDATGSTWTGDALVFLKRWKNTIQPRSRREAREPAFDVLSTKSADVLNIDGELQTRSISALAEIDLFELIDQRILSELVAAVTERTVSAEQCASVVRRRRATHWYAKYGAIYEALLAGARFMAALDGVTLTMPSAAQAFEQYRRHWYKLDQLYRHCISYARQAKQPTLLAPLLTQVENLYSNNYLLPLNDGWQVHVDGTADWSALPLPSQRNFFERYVRPFLRDGHKVSVIISDALRYEIGEELQQRIRREDRYEAELDAALTLLPSYTQLGVAALLPHATLAFDLKNDGSVLADGQKTQGTANRAKILAQALKGRGTALRAAKLLPMGRDESRALIREHDVVYVYQNRIDATGDKRDSEERVFDAVEETLDELITLIKKLANANANNILIAADHGFIYQNQPLDESDFLGDQVVGDAVHMRNRRFVLGEGLQETPGFRRFEPQQIDIHGAVDILIPKSINRLRVKGAGSRYVHGGAALQEVIVPVLRINKKRQSDIGYIDVDILQGSTSTITTGQLTAAFFQTEAVTAKRQPRALRAGIYTQAGDLISDQHTLLFDFASDNPRERERRVRFVLTSEADAANGQDVLLRLDERVGDTSHYKPYRSARYLLRRSFTSDFDF